MKMGRPFFSDPDVTTICLDWHQLVKLTGQENKPLIRFSCNLAGNNNYIENN